MRTRMNVTHELIGGKLHVYQREGTAVWQCATYLAGKNWRASTREHDLEKAKQKAADWYLNLQVKKRSGELVADGKSFEAASKKFMSEFEALTVGERSPKYVKGTGERIRVHLLPFFGPKAIWEITSQTVQDYRVHRMTSRIDPKTGQPKRPSPVTVKHEIVALRHVLKTALRMGWLKSLPDLSPPYRGSTKVSHRAWFSHDEYKQLYEATRERAESPPDERWQWECEQLHDFVLFMANTGLRPDEAARLQFRDVEIEKDRATGQTILVIKVRGKRGEGYCKSMPAAVTYFTRLKNRKRLENPTPHTSKGGGPKSKDLQLALPKPNDPIFPALRHDHLNAVLIEQGLKFDREGRRRTAYSLRHTYICFRLMEGADIYQIAKNCRTSVEMIEKHYAAHIKNMIDAAAVNVRSSWSEERPSRSKAKGLPATKSGAPKHRR